MRFSEEQILAERDALEVDWQRSIARNAEHLDEKALAALHAGHARRMSAFDRNCRYSLWEFCTKIDQQAQEIANLERFGKKMTITTLLLAAFSFWALVKIL